MLTPNWELAGIMERGRWVVEDEHITVKFFGVKKFPLAFSQLPLDLQYLLQCNSPQAYDNPWLDRMQSLREYGTAAVLTPA